MPGLLSRLNKSAKKKSSNTTARVVLPKREPTLSEIRPGESRSQTSSTIPTPSFSNLARDPSSLTTELQRATGDSLPWWVKSAPTISKKVEQVIVIAREILEERLAQTLISDEDGLRTAVRRAVVDSAQRISGDRSLSPKESEEAIHELQCVLEGIGPLQALFEDPEITDIFIDRFDHITCIRRGKMLETPFKFRSSREYHYFTEILLLRAGKILSAESPLASFALNNRWHSRVNLVHQSLCSGTDPSLAIRVTRLQQVSFYDLLKLKTLPATLAAWLSEVIAAGESSILVAGTIGSGKTTLASALLSATPSHDRIATFERVQELSPTATYFETFTIGSSTTTHALLLEAVLNRSPKRIALGEIIDEQDLSSIVRATEAGIRTVSTITTGSSILALQRIFDLVGRVYGFNSTNSNWERVTRSVQLVIFMRVVEGRPLIEELSEVVFDGVTVKLDPIVRFQGERDGKREWRIMKRDSVWLARMGALGHELRPGPALLAPE